MLDNTRQTRDGAIRVLLIEDEQPVASTLERILRQAGMVVEWAATASEAVERKSTFRPNVALVDLQLPDANGVDLISWLSSEQDCGVIVVTGAAGEADRVIGLELGADDYVAKPPSPRELIARVRAVYRRIRALTRTAPRASSEHIVDVGLFKIDLAARNVMTADGMPITLTGSQFGVLELLAKAKSEPVSRDELCRRALRREWQADDRGVDQLIFSLRQRLPNDRFGCSLIQSVRCLGYALRSAAPSTMAFGSEKMGAGAT